MHKPNMVDTRHFPGNAPSDSFHQILETTPDMPYAEQQKQVLRQIGTSHFFPPPHMDEAIVQWALDCNRDGAQCPLLDELPEMNRQFLCQELDTLARQFFDLTLRERKHKWNALRAACEGQTDLIHRLDHLANGLAVRRPPRLSDSDGVDEICDTLLKAFLAEPLTATHLKRELTSKAVHSRRSYAAAAKAIRHQNTYAAVSKLDPAWLHYLTTLADAKRRPLSDVPKLKPFKSGEASFFWIVWLVVDANRLPLFVFGVFMACFAAVMFRVELENPRISSQQYQIPRVPNSIEDDIVARTDFLSNEGIETQRIKVLKELIQLHPARTDYQWALLREYERIAPSSDGTAKDENTGLSIGFLQCDRHPTEELSFLLSAFEVLVAICEQAEEYETERCVESADRLFEKIVAMLPLLPQSVDHWSRFDQSIDRLLASSKIVAVLSELQKDRWQSIRLNHLESGVHATSTAEGPTP